MYKRQQGRPGHSVIFNGKTYSSITNLALHLGVSKQRVHQIIQRNKGIKGKYICKVEHENKNK